MVAGGRRCIGESFAKQQIFVVTLNLLQDFAVELDPGPPSHAHHLGSHPPRLCRHAREPAGAHVRFYPPAGAPQTYLPPAMSDGQRSVNASREQSQTTRSSIIQY